MPSLQNIGHPKLDVNGQQKPLILSPSIGSSMLNSNGNVSGNNPVTPKIFSGEIKHAPRTDVPQTVQGSNDSMNNMFGGMKNQPSVKSIQYLQDNVYV